MINWICYPRSQEPPKLVRDVVTAFQKNEAAIEEIYDNSHSNQILAIMREELEGLGFEVERGKKKEDKIKVPVLFGRQGGIDKYFEADAWHREGKLVLEIESGRGYTNNQFLKDLFQACTMHDVEYCGIAVRNLYRTSNDYEKVVTFFEVLYTSGRLKLPLKGVFVIGY